MNTKCFVSHAWRNGGHDFAIRLDNALQAEGVETWVDEREILPAQDVEQRMRDGVRRECSVFLFLLTPASLESEKCRIELTEALKIRVETGLQIIPVFVKDCRIPPRLKPLSYVDFRNEDNFDKAVKTLVTGIREAHLVWTKVSQLNKGDSCSRARAAQCLGALRNPFTVPVLTRRLFEDIHPKVRQWSAFALGQIRTRGALAALRKAKQKEKDPLALLGIEDALRVDGC